MMLFKIEGTEVFLFGSLHRGKPSFYPLPQAVEQAFASAEEIWFEAPPCEQGHPMTRCREGTTIRDYLSLRVFWLLRLALRKKYAGIKHLKPWALSMLYGAEAFTLEGCSVEFGNENQLRKRALEEKKRIKYLESAEAGLIGFDSAPQREQEETLLRCLIKFKDVHDEVKNMLNAWTKADLPEWDRQTEETVQKMPCFKRVLYERNQVWSPKLRDLAMSGKSCFVCVGASHLGGSESIQHFLKRDFGLTATQVPTIIRPDTKPTSDSPSYSTCPGK